MSDQPDGGPAFPGHPHNCSDGMTLRDFFAALALAMMGNTLKHGAPPAILAEVAYEIADAMLQRREGK